MDDFAQLRMFCEQNMVWLGSGAARITYLNPFDPSLVVKVPIELDDYCITQQSVEIKTLRKYAEFSFIPKFHVESLSFLDGNTVEILHMERLSPLRYEERNKLYESPDTRPAWTLGCSDGVQIGRTSTGQLKVYDLGYGFDASWAHAIGSVQDRNLRLGL